MATFSFNPFSGESHLSQWNNHLRQQAHFSDITSAIKTQTNAYRTEIRKARQDVTASLDATTKAQAAAISEASDVIVGSLEGGFSDVSEGLSGLSDGISDVQTSINDVGRMLDWRLTLMIDQQRISNLLIGNVALLLRIPDVQKERQYHIEQGFKHYKNAAIDADLYQDALENLLEAEKREKADYVVLHRIGMLYLYAPTLLDLPKAEDYFKRAAKYAVVESDPAAMRVFNVLAGDVSKTLADQSMDHDMVKNVASDSFFQAGIACYAQEKYSLAAELARKAFDLTPAMLEARFVQAKAIAAGGNEDGAAEVLETLIGAEPFYSVKTATDMELAPKACIKEMLARLRDDAIRRAKERVAKCKAEMIPSSKAKSLIAEFEAMLQRNSYLDAIKTLAGLASVRTWPDAEKGPMKQFTDLPEAVGSFVFHPEGETLAYTLGSEIMFYDLILGRETGRIHAVERIYSMAFNPAGTIMATGPGRFNSPIRLWDVAAGTEIRQMAGHSKSVHSVAFSADGAVLVSGSDDETARVWGVQSGAELSRIMTGHDRNRSESVAFSPTAQALGSVGKDGVIRLWDPVSGKEIRQMKRECAHRGKIESMKFSSIVFSPDENILAAVGSDGITLWDVASGAENRSFHAGYLYPVAFSPDGDILATVSAEATERKGEDTKYIHTIILSEVASGKEVRRLTGHSEWIRSVAFSPDGRLLASRSSDKSLRFWRNEHFSVESFIRVERKNAENQKRAEAKKRVEQERIKGEELARELDLNKKINQLLESAAAEELKQSGELFGKEKDYSTAISLYTQAASLGSERAKETLNRLTEETWRMVEAKKRSVEAEERSAARVGGVVGCLVGAVIGGPVGYIVGFVTGIFPGIIIMSLIQILSGVDKSDRIFRIWVYFCVIGGTLLGGWIGSEKMAKSVKEDATKPR